MGFFSSKKIYVASTVYNLAGDELDRPDYLKTLVVGNVISSSKNSMSDTLRNGYLGGPGMRMRTFFNWAENNYDLIGVPAGYLGGVLTSSDYSVIQGQIPVGAGETARLQHVELGDADYSYWAEQWMFENHPTLMDTAWTADADDATGDITVTFADATTATFTPADFVQTARYIYAAYTLSDGTTSSTRMFIYRQGSGNTTLDALFASETGDGEYFPFIPIRLDNEFLSETHLPDAYELAKKAYRKAGGGRFDKIVDKIADNPDLDDIDYAYIVYGVPLNVLDNAAREYLYRFFDKLRLSQLTTSSDYSDWQTAMETYSTEVDTWSNWEQAQSVPEDPLYGTSEPSVSTQPTEPWNYVRITDNGDLDTNYDIRIAWQLIEETTGSGLAKPDAQIGEIWLTVEANPPGWPAKISNEGTILETDYFKNTTFSITWQTGEDSWKKLTVIGAVHENLIYKKKAVLITGKEALEDADESGFIIPLHNATLREMRLVDSTQMATACTFVVFNSYKVVKRKWYQTGFFKLFVFVALIALMVFVPPLGAGATAGFMAIGTAIGLTGIAALIVGAVITQLVMMIVMKLINKFGIAVFGRKFGQLFAAIATVVVMTMGQGLLAGGSLSAAWGSMMSASNLINLTIATANGVSGYIAASAQGVIQDTQKLLEKYNKESREISELFAQNIGYGNGMINPLGLTDVSLGNTMETEAQFLSRTLMTGSDIAELSMDMLTNFAEYTLTTDLPFDDG